MKFLPLLTISIFSICNAAQQIHDQSKVKLEGIINYSKGVGPDLDEKIIKYASMKLQDKVIAKDVMMEGDEYDIDSIQLIFENNSKEYAKFKNNINKFVMIEGRFTYVTTSRFALPNRAKLYVDRIEIKTSEAQQGIKGKEKSTRNNNKSNAVGNKSNDSYIDAILAGAAGRTITNRERSGNSESEHKNRMLDLTNQSGWGTGNGGTRQGKFALGAKGTNAITNKAITDNNLTSSRIIRIIPEQELNDFRNYLLKKESDPDIQNAFKNEIDLLSQSLDKIIASSKACRRDEIYNSRNKSCIDRTNRMYSGFLNEFASSTQKIYDYRTLKIASINDVRAKINACASETESFLNPLFSPFNRRTYYITKMNISPYDDQNSTAVWSIAMKSDASISEILFARINKWHSNCDSVVLNMNAGGDSWNQYFINSVERHIKFSQYKRDGRSIYSVSRWKQSIYINGTPVSIREDDLNGIEYLDPDRRWGENINGKTNIVGDSANVIIFYEKAEDVIHHEAYIERG